MQKVAGGRRHGSGKEEKGRKEKGGKEEKREGREEVLLTSGCVGAGEGV